MSRARKESGTVEIIHSSFIDLLFGAFGAFVFLMIVYVIYTMQLTPEKLKNAIDEVTQKNQQLQEELKGYNDLKKKYNKLSGELDDINKKKHHLEDKYNEAKKKQHDLEIFIVQLNKDKKILSDKLKKLENAKKNIVIILDENKKLKTKIEKLKIILVDNRTKLSDMRKKIDGLRDSITKLTNDKKTEKKNQLKDWFKYLFFAVLFILGSELSAALTSLEINRGHQILAEDGAELVFVAEKNIWEIHGGNSDTIDKRRRNRQFFAGLRTILWVSILVAAYIFSIKMLNINISILWMLGISVMLYIYLRFRFNLLPTK